MRWTFLLVGVGLLFFLNWYSYTSPLRVSAEEAKRRTYEVYLDVRTAAERRLLGSYPGSIHIPAGDLERQAPSKLPNKNASILVYCNTGQRSRFAAEKLQAMGYTNVHYIATTYRDLL
jgi:phage shock protein E